MSYEFFAALDASVKFPLLGLADRLNLSSALTVLVLKENELQLSWRKQPIRTEWPEDVSVIRDSKGIFVQFHTGTRGAYPSVLAEIAAAVAALAVTSIEFSEN